MTVAPRDQNAKDYPVRLPGHALHAEGAAYTVPDCAFAVCQVNHGNGGHAEPVRVPLRKGQTGGHAVCTCGVTSVHLLSTGQRKRWHRDHKREVAS